MKKYNDEDRAKARERRRRKYASWISCTPEWKRAQHLKDKYGLSIEEYNKLLDKVGNTCPICGKSFGEVSPVIDHNHKTNRVRGIICRHCNLGIGFLEDDVKILYNAVKWVATE